MKKFYVTTPIYYVNANPHIGHTYTSVAADILARYHKMLGEKTFFLTGTDEHGAKVAEMAEKAGKNPQEFVDEIAAKFKLAWDELNISNDNFIRTTNPEHKQAVQKALQFMYDKGDICEGKYEGLYCQACEQFKNEKDLVNGLCPDHKTEPQKLQEESYMFKMSKYQDELLEKIKSGEFEIQPEAKKNEIVSFIEAEGLKDISFSRKNVKWGIELPWDKSHTTYVWADAFLNYLTGLGWNGEPGNVPEMWPADVQLMSKDILRVHATIWPAMLMSLELDLPKKLFIHGYFNYDGEKMSKSLGNVITPGDLKDKYGVDGARYLVASAAVFGQDGDISWARFDEKYNADLANGLGNLVARSATLAENMKKNGIELRKTSAGDTVINDKYYSFSHEAIIEAYTEYMNHLQIDKVLKLIFGGEDQAPLGILKFLDGYITNIKPWELIKNKNEQVGEIMYNILERIRHVALMVYPFMPETAEKIYEMLELGSIEKVNFAQAIEWGGLPETAVVKKGESLFPRI